MAYFAVIRKRGTGTSALSYQLQAFENLVNAGILDKQSPDTLSSVYNQLLQMKSNVSNPKEQVRIDRTLNTIRSKIDKYSSSQLKDKTAQILNDYEISKERGMRQLGANIPQLVTDYYAAAFANLKALTISIYAYQDRTGNTQLTPTQAKAIAKLQNDMNTYEDIMNALKNKDANKLSQYNVVVDTDPVSHSPVSIDFAKGAPSGYNKLDASLLGMNVFAKGTSPDGMIHIGNYSFEKAGRGEAWTMNSGNRKNFETAIQQMPVDFPQYRPNHLYYDSQGNYYWIDKYDKAWQVKPEDLDSLGFQNPRAQAIPLLTGQQFKQIFSPKLLTDQELTSTIAQNKYGSWVQGPEVKQSWFSHLVHGIGSMFGGSTKNTTIMPSTTGGSTTPAALLPKQ